MWSQLVALVLEQDPGTSRSGTSVLTVLAKRDGLWLSVDTVSKCQTISGVAFVWRLASCRLTPIGNVLVKLIYCSLIVELKLSLQYTSLKNCHLLRNSMEYRPETLRYHSMLCSWSTIRGWIGTKTITHGVCANVNPWTHLKRVSKEALQMLTMLLNTACRNQFERLTGLSKKCCIMRFV